MRAVGSGAAGAANHQPPELINDERRGKTPWLGTEIELCRVSHWPQSIYPQPRAVRGGLWGEGEGGGAGAVWVGDTGTTIAARESAEQG